MGQQAPSIGELGGQNICGKNSGQVVSLGMAIPRYSMVLAAGFRVSSKEVEVYMLEKSELCGTDKAEELAKESILAEYQDMQGAFNEEASNKLPEHGV